MRWRKRPRHAAATLLIAALRIEAGAAGLAYGAGVDGTGAWPIAIAVASVVGALAAALWLASARLAHKGAREVTHAP